MKKDKDLALELKDIMTDIHNTNPVLLVGAYVRVFKIMFKGDIKRVSSTKEIRDLVTQYTGIKSLDRPLIIEDLAFLSENATFFLLKLVEEAKFPIILLSLYDSVSEIILSRVKVVKKAPLEEIKCQYMEPSIAYDAMMEYLSKDSHINDKLRWMRDNSPKLYRIMESTKRCRNREKIIRILS